MFTYPKVLKRKEIKKISKYPCDDKIKDAYLKYLTNYSFEEFAGFCQDNGGDLEESVLRFADLQLERFKPNSLIWISHVMVNFMVYVDVNLDCGECYDAYASALQLTVLSCAMKMVIDKISFDEVPFPVHSKICFDKIMERCPDFKYNLKTDCTLAYKSFNNDFGFTPDEFYHKMRNHFADEGY
ncbi:hypothetical protein [uncultured Methanobrevibacter sp.]|uniref:hypothetical protein n=1 Tax=uncultured Methanobrevibacter sp. TaxID=253161 RepID=UPI00260ABBDF|nr:hypothetical protein [uncultured Methanobrevibacter sp.]